VDVCALPNYVSTWSFPRLAKWYPSTLLHYVKDSKFPANGATSTQNICDLPISNMTMQTPSHAFVEYCYLGWCKHWIVQDFCALTLTLATWVAHSSRHAIFLHVHARVSVLDFRGNICLFLSSWSPHWATSKRHSGDMKVVNT
jgi:hypothetical protein